jgi:hypothetical protein
MMKTRFGILFTTLVTLALLGSVGIAAAAPAVSSGMQAGNTIAPSNGPITPGSSLYGLKIAFENLDESFTFNQSAKLEKQISHADLRLTELKQELADNRTDAAEIALDQYRQKMNQTENTLAPLPLDDNGDMSAANDSVISHAGEMIAKHQQVLEDLLQSHPDNQGLARAYNNSVELEQKFAEKTEIRSQHRQDSGNSTFEPMQNMTRPDPAGRFGEDNNMTMTGNENQSWSRGESADNSTMDFPHGMNQTINRNGQDQSGRADNSTVGFPQGMNQTMNRNGHDQNGQATNQTAPGQPPGNKVPGNSQNQNNNGNTNTGKNTNNYGNTATGGNTQNTNTGTGHTNNNGNTGAITGGNSNEKTRFNGR